MQDAPTVVIEDIVFIVWSGNGSNQYTEDQWINNSNLPTNLSTNMFGSIKIKYSTSNLDGTKQIKEIIIHDDLLVLSYNICFRALLELENKRMKPFQVNCYSQPGMIEMEPFDDLVHVKFSFSKSNQCESFVSNREELFRKLFGCGERIIQIARLISQCNMSNDELESMIDFAHSMYEKVQSNRIGIVPYYHDIFEIKN